MSCSSNSSLYSLYEQNKKRKLRLHKKEVKKKRKTRTQKYHMLRDIKKLRHEMIFYIKEHKYKHDFSVQSSYGQREVFKFDPVYGDYMPELERFITEKKAVTKYSIKLSNAITLCICITRKFNCNYAGYPIYTVEIVSNDLTAYLNSRVVFSIFEWRTAIETIMRKV
jgi:hypothetical protein